MQATRAASLPHAANERLRGRHWLAVAPAAGSAVPEAGGSAAANCRAGVAIAALDVRHRSIIEADGIIMLEKLTRSFRFFGRLAAGGAIVGVAIVAAGLAAGADKLRGAATRQPRAPADAD
ncbi:MULTISPECIES: hypothetical protein [Burkholderia]|nr:MULTISPECIES: hypothetical protein [unclassified Burkholderia]